MRVNAQELTIGDNRWAVLGPSPMSISALLKSHHAHCDGLFIELEQLCLDGRWNDAKLALSEFRNALEAHLSEEEDCVFPAFEAATGMHSGPTHVMRIEHRQMRGLVTQIDDAVSQCDSDSVAGTIEVLLILMQQHNLKEESILYPMFDQALPTQETINTLHERMENICPT